MGAKQSSGGGGGPTDGSPPVQSTTGSVPGSNNSRGNRTLSSGRGGSGGGGGVGPSPVGGSDSRQRARSLSHVPSSILGQAPTSTLGIGIPSSIATGNGMLDISGSPDSDASSTTDDGFGNITSGLISRVFAAHSLPTQLSSFNGIRCPVCSKFVLHDDIEYHLVVCLTKPRICYNEDVLPEDKGECVICLDDLKQGDTIARLPCLCIYHKSCIDSWFEVNRSCPEHPLD